MRISLRKRESSFIKPGGPVCCPLLHQEQDLVILEKPEKAPDICDRVLRFTEKGVEE